MSRRIRWYLIEPLSEAAVAAIAAKMRKDAYADKRGWGFAIEIIRKNLVEGRFIERYENIDKVTDPFGKEIEFKRIGYEITRFRLNTSAPQFEVYDGPRSISALTTQIAGYLNFALVFKEVATELGVWLRALERKITRSIVTMAVIAEVPLSPNAYAKLTVCGTEDVRKHATSLVGSKRVRFQKLQISGRYAEESVKLEVASDGRATILLGNAEELLPILRESLVGSLQQPKPG